MEEDPPMAAIVARIALVLGTIIILMVIRKIFLIWASQYSPVHYGAANMEDVEMMEVAPEPLYRQPSRSSIRTNPHTKQHAAIKNDRIRELLTHPSARKSSRSSEATDLQGS